VLLREATAQRGGTNRYIVSAVPQSETERQERLKIPARSKSCNQ